jgi:hypothetical protein
VELVVWTEVVLLVVVAVDDAETLVVRVETLLRMVDEVVEDEADVLDEAAPREMTETVLGAKLATKTSSLAGS